MLFVVRFDLLRRQIRQPLRKCFQINLFVTFAFLRLLMFFVVGRWQKRFDQSSETTLRREVRRKFAYCHIEHAESERTEDSDSLRILLRFSGTVGNVSQ